jgi:hypothetical protein
MLTLLWSPDRSGTLIEYLWDTCHYCKCRHANQPVQFDGSPVNYCWSLLGGYLESLQSVVLLSALLVVYPSTALMSVFVRGPEQVHLFLLSAAIGVIFGWLVPTERVLFVR